MALQDFIALADDKLHELFSRKAYDPQRDRAAMVKRLDNAHAQFTATEPTRGRKMWRLNNGVVELTLPFAIGGKSVFHIPTERFADAIEHLKHAIGKGEADAELKAHAEGASGVGPAAAKPSKAASSTGARYAKESRSWSPERRAKFQETIAARAAAKQK